ncbi:MAG: glycyl-radical enzyme activating protein [Desulfosalsimonas sp.]
MTHSQKGLIHGIERFSLHDGPGVRTLVVMKGCPLRCRWCSSPYTQQTRPELLHIKSRCQGCGRCVEACPNHAIRLTDAGAPVITDRTLCNGCGECVAVCVNRAREISGTVYTPRALLEEVKKDESFFRRSGGGVTVGGGEPTMQAEFAGEFLTLCRAHGFHTVMETCSMTSWEKLAPLLECLDLVYMDLKHMDAEQHRQWTGASNERILENIRSTAQSNEIILRIPVIPGFNDDEANISASAAFAGTLGGNLVRLELLPFHQFGIHRYEELDRGCSVESLEPPSDNQMALLRDTARAFGIDVQIGG